MTATPTDWARIVATVGVPSLISLLLVWFLVSGIVSDVQAMRTEHQELRFYLRAICVNTAKTEAERAACVLPPPHQP